MKKLLFVALALVVAGLSVNAQPAGRAASTGGKSPHETTSAVIDKCRVTITYGRPYTKDPKTGEARKIWGGLVPYGKAWRLGADEATLLLTEQSLMIGETEIPAGAYTLYLVPGENDCKLAFSKHLGKWGIPVDEKNDVTRVDAKKDATDKQVDQFTMTVGKNSDGGGVIKMMWENTQYSVAFTVKK